jgi:hypothetical protein
MTRTLPTKDDKTQVTLAHFLIANRGAGHLPEAHITLGFEWSPRSLGKLLLELGYLKRDLKAKDPFTEYGTEPVIEYNNHEKVSYALLAWQAEKAIDAVGGANFGIAMRYRMASLAMREMAYQPICHECASIGCRECHFLGKTPMSKTSRIRHLETNLANWNKHLGLVYQDIFLPAVGAQEREAARVWLRVMMDRLPDRIGELVLDAESIIG